MSLLLFMLLILFASSTFAELNSSYYSGTTYFDEPWGEDGGYIRGHIDFAVFDDRNEYETLMDFNAPGTGQYVYAYQIFNDDEFSDESIAYFAV